MQLVARSLVVSLLMLFATARPSHAAIAAPPAIFKGVVKRYLEKRAAKKDLKTFLKSNADTYKTYKEHYSREQDSHTLQLGASTIATAGLLGGAVYAKFGSPKIAAAASGLALTVGGTLTAGAAAMDLATRKSSQRTAATMTLRSLHDGLRPSPERIERWKSAGLIDSK